MKCPHCGEEQPPPRSSIFCIKCGREMFPREVKDKIDFLVDQLKGETLLTDEARKQIKELKEAIKQVISKLHEAIDILNDLV